MSQEETIGLVVVGYDSDPLWPQFFDGIQESSRRPGHIVVVENSKTAPRTIPSSSKGVEVLHLPENPGFGTAVNRGVQLLPPEVSWVFIANSDSFPSPEAFATLLAVAHDYPDAGAFGPAIVGIDGSTYPSARAIPGVRIGVGHALLGALFPRNPWTQRYLGNYVGSGPRSAGWLSGSFMLVKREAFIDVDGFDESYFMFFEDVDLCYRLKIKGWKSVYVPSARVTHLGGYSTEKNIKEMVRAHHDSALIFLRKLYPAWFQAPLRAVLKLGLAVRSFVASRLYAKR